MERYYIRYLNAYKEQDVEYRKSGSWHVDLCNCQGCQDISTWLKLSWWTRFKIKMAL